MSAEKDEKKQEKVTDAKESDLAKQQVRKMALEEMKRLKKSQPERLCTKAFASLKRKVKKDAWGDMGKTIKRKEIDKVTGKVFRAELDKAMTEAKNKYKEANLDSEWKETEAEILKKAEGRANITFFNEQFKAEDGEVDTSIADQSLITQQISNRRVFIANTKELKKKDLVKFKKQFASDIDLPSVSSEEATSTPQEDFVPPPPAPPLPPASPVEPPAPSSAVPSATPSDVLPPLPPRDDSQPKPAPVEGRKKGRVVVYPTAPAGAFRGRERGQRGRGRGRGRGARLK